MAVAIGQATDIRKLETLSYMPRRLLQEGWGSVAPLPLLSDNRPLELSASAQEHGRLCWFRMRGEMNSSVPTMFRIDPLLANPSIDGSSAIKTAC